MTRDQMQRQRTQEWRRARRKGHDREGAGEEMERATDNGKGMANGVKKGQIRSPHHLQENKLQRIVPYERPRPTN